MHKTLISRRSALFGGSALTAGFFLSSAAFGAAKTLGTGKTGDITMNSIHFKNGTIDMAGNVFLPKGFEARQKHPAIVVVHPGGGSRSRPPASMRKSSPSKAS